MPHRAQSAASQVTDFIPATTPAFTMAPRYQDGAANRRIGLTLPDNQQEAWGYDPAGRVNSLIQPGATPNTWTVTHDGAGNLTSLSAPNGGLESWGYDTAGRPISTTWTLGLGGASLSTQTATHDAAGQRTQCGLDRVSHQSDRWSKRTRDQCMLMQSGP